jgi:predicted O-methyltransferase YrrM
MIVKLFRPVGSVGFGMEMLKPTSFVLLICLFLVTIELTAHRLGCLAWPIEVIGRDNPFGAQTVVGLNSNLPVTVKYEKNGVPKKFEFEFNADGRYIIETCMENVDVDVDVTEDLKQQYCENMADDLFFTWYTMNYYPGLHLDRSHHEQYSRTADFFASRGTVLALLADRKGYKNYLEIGTAGNKIFRYAQAHFEVAVGVDPWMGGTVRLTSDEFFAGNMQTFDLIFVDGLHEANQVYRDVTNALDVLNEGGIIVMHDCNPHGQLDVTATFPPKYANVSWNGDVWKAVVALRLLHANDLDIVVIDVDHGVGVIRRRPSSNPYSQEWIDILSLAAPTEAGYEELPVGSIAKPEYAIAVINMLTNDHLHHFRKQLLPLTSIDGMLAWFDDSDF